MIDNILIVSPPDYNHNQCFFEIAMSFASAFKSLGHELFVTTNADDCDGKTLVFGAHLITKMGGEIDGDYIICQTEQLGAGGSLFVDEAYLELLKRLPVWDYSLNNIVVLENHGIVAKHVPIGYSKCMSNIKTGRSAAQIGGGKNGKQRVDFAEWSGIYPPVGPDGKFVQDVDVTFYGSVNDRRNKILEELRRIEIDGKPIIVASFLGYGGFRDKIIARSKIVLNMHYYDSAIFEIFRCSHLFANKRCLVSEMGKDASLEDAYYDTGGFTEYDNLINRCVELLNDEGERNEVANIGHDIFKKTLQADILKGVL